MVGVLVIAWMTFSSMLPEQFAGFRSALHTNMVIVVGTLSIFLVGILVVKGGKLKA